MNKINHILQIQKAAKLYKKNLVGKKFALVYEQGYIEIIFSSKNFKHLVGVDSPLYAKQFFSDALHNRLNEKTVLFSERHPYRVSVKKVTNLLRLTSLIYSDSFLLEEINTTTKHYKIGATNLDFTLCFNYPKDDYGKITNECLRAESLRDEDCFAKSSSVYEITHIFAKNNDEEFYNEICYMDNRYSINDIPTDVLQTLKLDSNIIT